MRARPLHGVAVHPLHDFARKLLNDLGLQFFGALPLIADRWLVAHRAFLIGRLLGPTVMAQQRVMLAVMRECQIAMQAVSDVAARGAMDVGGEAAPIQQQHHLPTFVEGVLHRFLERRANGVEDPARFRLMAQIDQAHERQRAIENALGQASAACSFPFR